MPRILWPHWQDRPSVQIVLTQTATGQPFPRILLADSGAGTWLSAHDLLLIETDCLNCGSRTTSSVRLGGAYRGLFPVYVLTVQVPALGFTQRLLAVGVPAAPSGFDGLACFRFLNRFTYGNFGDPGRFGLEC